MSITTDVVDQFASLGFADVVVLNEALPAADKTTKVLVRVKTSTGWAYEKFSRDGAMAEIAAWAAKRSPAG